MKKTNDNLHGCCATKRFSCPIFPSLDLAKKQQKTAEAAVASDCSIEKRHY